LLVKKLDNKIIFLYILCHRGVGLYVAFVIIFINYITMFFIIDIERRNNNE